ncbi:Inner membrane protein translocase component YidC, long form [Acidisarcina polymorpha]|uniref:Membrane protein insertase YidC n=1 Tax=Acidisarcina polymorpha TaxID=2211140 RepID=A0A2Z5FWX5_9BACT|nr:membrane protein insertase YidC [Acidisarcina polymorpha]AXC11393.1 Inner membrane protein translocase component YidC, long form [Acidisarcina polymorpha]
MPEIKNPNQQGGGGQDPKTMLAFTAIFILMFLGLQYFKPKKTPETGAQQQQRSLPATAETPASSPASPAATATAKSGVVSAANAVQASSESSTIVENELYRVQFSNRGAQVTSWILKKYKDGDGKPLDLVNQKAAAQFGYPLSLFTYDSGLRTRLSEALFVPSTTGVVNAPGSVTFTWSDGSLTARKKFSFDSSYVVHAETSVEQNGTPVTALLTWPSGFGDQETLPQFAKSSFNTMQAGKSTSDAYKKVIGGATLNGPFDWAGVSDLYFAAIFLPDAPQQTTVVQLHNEETIPRNIKKPDPNATDRAPVLGAAMGVVGGSSSARLYAGPKLIDVLKSVKATGPAGKPTGPDIEPIVSFGWMKFISEPLFLILHWMHEHIVSNWGWSILLLTLLINLCMLPTRITMMKSALKMQRIQPQMEAIKERYKKYKMNDPRRQDMNKEIFDLQKKEGANMFGGCLPMLIQWPLLYGFYNMLSNVFELRQAHWLWLPDLASPDPLHILPVFFIVSMFLVQYLTPSPGVDPAQQRMMAFTMPAVFGFMTWSVASGLALYWACGNIVNIVQQTVMNRTSLGREMHDIAAKRAAKRLGKPAASRR